MVDDAQFVSRRHQDWTAQSLNQFSDAIIRSKWDQQPTGTFDEQDVAFGRQRRNMLDHALERDVAAGLPGAEHRSDRLRGKK